MDDVDRHVLEFEQQWFRTSASKEQAIRDRLGLTVTQYAQRLNRLVDDPAACIAFPQLTNRLRRLRDERRRVRTSRRAS